ncbi:hypothetical protein DB88DRAFT_472216 [Papiliotrema laurentii]|uniref:Uncharacterized protein n=1 Tax=Papiliotrema laurentii TaxID=5418 RepID=A0AAD9FRJ9_PAPLA|nr:hypothetical protein DB88DRAFT_472216 [Papiliotrema laurentii]
METNSTSTSIFTDNFGQFCCSGPVLPHHGAPKLRIPLFLHDSKENHCSSEHPFPPKPPSLASLSSKLSWTRFHTGESFTAASPPAHCQTPCDSTHIVRDREGELGRNKRKKLNGLPGLAWLGKRFFGHGSAPSLTRTGRDGAWEVPCEPSLWQRPGEEGSSADRSVTPIRMTNRASIHILPILGWSSDLMGLWGTYHASIIFWSSTSSRLDGCLGKLVGYSHFDFEPSLSPPD